MPLTINSEQVDIMIPSQITANVTDFGDEAKTEFSKDLSLAYLSQYDNRTIYLEVVRASFRARVPKDADEAKRVMYKIDTDLKLMNSTSTVLMTVSQNAEHFTTTFTNPGNVVDIEQGLNIFELASIPKGKVNFKFTDLSGDGEALTLVDSSSSDKSFLQDAIFQFNVYIMKEGF